MITTLRDVKTKTSWIIDEQKRRFGALYVPGMTRATRALVATDLGLRYDNGAIQAPRPLLVPINDRKPPRAVVRTAETGRWFRIDWSSAGIDVSFWVVPGLRLSGRSYADALRRRLPEPWTQAEERLLAAFSALPGYPVQMHTSRSEDGWSLVNTVFAIDDVHIPASLFALPKDYTRTDGLQIVSELAQAQDESKHLYGFGNVACASANGALFKDRPIPQNEKIDRIVILKGRNELQAWAGKRLLKRYKVAVGGGRAGPKRYSGDKKTPEGTYRIDRRFASKKYHRFLHVSYPNSNDRKAFKRGRAQGTIPKSASIGGAIGIHGEKKGFTWLPHKWMNWTRGCVALDNDEIEELYRLVVKNALVVIKP